METNNQTQTFPSDFKSPKEKIGKGWGLQAAKAIYSNYQYAGSTTFFKSRKEHQTYINYALGEQGEEEYKPVLGINPQKQRKDFIKAIRWQIKNYATKRVNVATEKLFQAQYDCIIDAIDKLATDQKVDFKARVRAYMENQKFLAEIGVATTFFEESGYAPQDSDELEMLMNNPFGFKHYNAMKVELGIKEVLEDNKFFSVVKRLVDWDLFVLGSACLWCEMDENINPIVKRINPSKVIVPETEDPFFHGIPYIAYMDYMDIPTFKKKISSDPKGNYSEDYIKDIIARFGKDHNAMQSDTTDYHSNTFTDNEQKVIPVMRFRILSTDDVTYIKKTDIGGNSMMYRQPYEAYRKEQEINKFKLKYGDSRQLLRKEYYNVYEGYWVVNSECVFNYDLMHHMIRNYGNLSETSLGVALVAPNKYGNKTVSTVKQMIPALDQLQTYHIKVQHLVASAIPKGFGIDLHALRRAELKVDGKKMSDMDKINMFVQSGILVFDSSDRDLRGANYKPFVETMGGIADDLEKMLMLTQQALLDLDEIIGLNRVSVGSTLAPDQGKGTAELQMHNTEIAMGYLYHADKYLYEEACRMLSKLYVQSIKYGDRKPASYGKSSMTLLVDANTDITKHDYAVSLKAKPTKEEWQKFYLTVEKAYDKGVIMLSDRVMLEELDNLKQARLYLQVVERRRAREQQQAAMDDIQNNAQVQNQSLQLKHQSDKELEQMKGQNGVLLEKERQNTVRLQIQLEQMKELRLARLQGQIDSKLQQEESESDMKEKKYEVDHRPKPTTNANK